MARKYTTQTRIENYLLIDIDETFESQIEEWIEDMTEYIEIETGRIFEADSESTSKLYEVKHSEADVIGQYVKSLKDLYIDEAVEVESVSIDDVAVDSDNYLLYPANTTPKTRIKLTEDSGLTFTQGEQNIEVSAKWGYSVEPPRDIVFACTVLVSGIINYSNTAQGEVKSVSMGTYTMVFKDEKQLNDLDRVKEILEKYKKVL